jgi:predicted LPLAT superfamily acyltransferase
MPRKLLLVITEAGRRWERLVLRLERLGPAVCAYVLTSSVAREGAGRSYLDRTIGSARLSLAGSPGAAER